MTAPMTDSIAILCPGQGSQFPGMAREIQRLPQGQSFLDSASELTGLPITDLLTKGSAADIARPSVAQVGVLCHSLALLDAIDDVLESGLVCAGHSVGEYAAMVAAGMLDAESALALVVHRGRVMQEDADRVGGGMGAVVGLRSDDLAELCSAATQQPVVLANHNSPRQLVVSGTREGVAEVLRHARSAGAIRARELPVGGAYHSPLMHGADEKMAVVWSSVRLRPSAPGTVLVSSVDGRVQTDPSAQRANMRHHLSAPVRWSAAMVTIGALRPARAIELGPGRVLRGLAREMLPEVAFDDLPTLVRHASGPASPQGVSA